jgi:hypothetical protein
LKPRLFALTPFDVAWLSKLMISTNMQRLASSLSKSSGDGIDTAELWSIR